MSTFGDDQILETFSDRELEILGLLAKGYTNKQIAQELFLSDETVKWYNKQIYSKLGVHNRTQAGIRARGVGLLAEGKPTTSASRHSLPATSSSFIGRDEELADIFQRLTDPTCRLLTLTGPGGIGKTRLALQVAGERQSEYKDGVWLVELAALADEVLVPQALAAILGVHEQPRQPLSETLARYLYARDTLLLLDNCEHLITACAQLSTTLLASCPNLRILATSREPLGVPGEGVWVVPPLSLPDPQPWGGPASGGEDLSAYRQSESVQLFIARARAAASSFELTVENGSWVAEICRRLDGIPLAIELAAARTRVYSARQIAEHLGDRFQLLTSRLRAGPQRHQTLAATLDWSYNILTEKERAMLRRLAVFAGGWTLEASKAVCAGDEIATAEVIDVLSNLVDKSLVAVDRSPGGRRFHYLETIRQYAQQKLIEAGEADMIRDRHLDYFLIWTETSATNLVGSEETKWLRLFDTEYGNLRAAIDWSHADKERGGQGLRLAAACGRFWRMRGYFSEGREHLHTALNLTGTTEHTEVRAIALSWAASLAYKQSDYHATDSLAGEALALSRELGPAGRAVAARSLDLLGETATEIGDYQTAPWFFEEALAIYRELEDKRNIADMVMQMGFKALRVGEYKRAESLLNESYHLIQELDEPAMLGFALAGLGELAVRKRRFDKANKLLAESLALRREIGDRWGIAAILGSLGWTALLQRDFIRMRKMLAESLAIRVEIGDPGGIAWCLEKLAEATAIEAPSLPPPHRPRTLRRAVCLFSASQALRQPLNSVIDPADQPEYERILATLLGALDRKAFDAAWSQGASLSLQQAIDLALSPVVSSGEAAALSDVQVTKAGFGGLTRRERETARWIAQGKSNREIAAAMTVSVRTIETYVTRIMNKLGFDSRVQIAVWAVEKGLGETEV